MILNPKTLIEKRIISFSETINIEQYLQQIGIDIDCIKIYENKLFENKITLIGKEIKKTPEQLELTTMQLADSGIEVFYLYKGHSYLFESSFKVEVPINMCCKGLVNRSTFNRNGVMIRSGIFDPGYQGTIGGTIYCFNDILIEKGTRIAQFVMEECDSYSLYSGQYQGVLGEGLVNNSPTNNTTV